MAGHDIRAYFNFDLDETCELKIKFALSNVSAAGALKNLAAEVPQWDFDKTKREGQQLWNNELSKIRVEMLDNDDSTVFTQRFTIVFCRQLFMKMLMDSTAD